MYHRWRAITWRERRIGASFYLSNSAKLAGSAVSFLWLIFILTWIFYCKKVYSRLLGFFSLAKHFYMRGHLNCIRAHSFTLILFSLSQHIQFKVWSRGIYRANQLLISSLVTFIQPAISFWTFFFFYLSLGPLSNLRLYASSYSKRVLLFCAIVITLAD